MLTSCSTMARWLGVSGGAELGGGIGAEDVEETRPRGAHLPGGVHTFVVAASASRRSRAERAGEWGADGIGVTGKVRVFGRA